jgi:hypothetical protein
MAPPAEHLLRTPDRRASSYDILNAFRKLTGGRHRGTAPAPSTASATYTPVRALSVGSVHPGSVANSHTADGSLQRITQVASEGNRRAVIGGPPELGALVEQLDSSRPSSERQEAVDRICTILAEYPVQNVLGLWSVASDLILQDQPDHVVASGYKLLGSIVSDPKLTPVERTVFFAAASQPKSVRCFDKQLDVIKTLTNGGKNIAACESSIVPYLLCTLDSCFKASREAHNSNRKATGKRSVDNPTQEAANLAAIFQYASDVCKFNARILTDDDLECLLAKAMAICQETTQECDMANCIRLFDTIITYVHVPTKALRSSLEVLCAIHRQIGSLQEQTWNTLSNLFKSHVGQAAIMSLLHTLLDGPTRKNRQYSLYRGTIQVLQLLLLEDGRNQLPKVPLSLVLPALKASIKEPHQTQEEFVVNLVDAVLDQESMRQLLLAEVDLTDLLDIIRMCAERDNDRLRAKIAGTTESSTTTQNESIEAMHSTHENGSSRGGRSATISNLLNVLTPAGVAKSSDLVSSPGAAEDVHSPLADAPATHSARPEAIRRTDEDSIFKLLTKLDNMSDAMDFVQKDGVMELFLHCAHRLSDPIAEKTIRYFVDERYLNPSHTDWLSLSRTLVVGILQDASRPRPLRLLAIQTLRETYNTVEQVCAGDQVMQCGALLLDSIETEEDHDVLHNLVDFAVDVADRASMADFRNIVQVLETKLHRLRTKTTASSPAWSPYAFHVKSDLSLGSHCNIVATAFVRLFTRSITHSAPKTRILYESLRGIAGNDKYEHDARLTALKLLFRLRADSRHAVIVSSFSDGERLAAELCRTEETAVAPEKHDGAQPMEHSKSEDSITWRKASGPSPHATMSRHTSRTTAATGRFIKPILPLWMYPGPKGLPEEPSSESSRVVFSHIDASEYPLSDDVLDMEITLWLELIISLLQRPPDWEVYSYVLVHLGPQLSNQALVRSCVVQLRMLRNVLCEQVRNSSFHEPPAHTLLKKADVAVCLFHTLTVLISYHEYFEKSEEDDLVKAFLQGMTQWDRTSKWCIHALSVCCFELPLSVSKSLDSVVQKMSQIVTKPAVAVHILEFLTTLARLPDLYKNFREDEFKMVFGVCFRYLQYIRDQRSRTANPSASQGGQRALRHSGTSKDFVSTPDSVPKLRSVEDDLPEYLYSLAFHVVTFWFLALKMEDRPKQIPWITRNLHHTDSSGRQTLEDFGEVIIDIMNMVAWTDRDETTRNENFSKPGDGEIWKKTWIVGNGMVTIETAARTGLSQITTRRPCGTRYLTLQPSLAPPPRHQVPITVGLASEAFYSSSYLGILPEDIFQSFYGPLDMTNLAVPLPDDDMTRRAIATFDRIATIDSFKVGVIYIGEGQTNERDIFMNDIGSPAYTSFLSDLGTLCRLKDAKFNTGGLDTRANVDGEFTYCWRDRCIELVFHVTTMMPTNRDDDMTYPNKKRHIGNDFVNIIFNDSGLPYDFDTFPSAFNYVHIVVSPESRASFVDRRLDPSPSGRDRYYKVQTVSKPGFPDISPASETKILCGAHLATYCRLIAINACVFSNVWFVREGGENISSWRNRLREIKRLRDRHGADASALHTHSSTPASPVPSQAQGGSQSHGIASPPPRDNIPSPFQRMSVATFMTEGGSRSSISSSSHDV